MKLKYQMRGLGIGIIVTAILMGVTTSHGIPLTDAEIKARALELGMVESNSLKLTDVGGMKTPEPEHDREQGSGTEGQEPGAEGAGSGTEGQEPGVEGSGAEGQEPGTEGAGSGTEGQEPGTQGAGSGRHVPEGSESDSSENSSSHVAREGDKITVIIEPGTDSYDISEVLAAAGLVEDAGEFDAFLCSNLYSRKIVDGTYEIPVGSSEEEIAKIITRQAE